MKTTCILVATLLLAAIAGATDYSVNQDNTYGPWTLQAAATSGNGNTINFRGSTSGALCYLIWGAGTSAGSVIFETAPTAGFPGTTTWAPLATVSWAEAGQVDEFLRTAPIGVLRARIVSVTGGSVTVTCSGLR